MWDRDGGCGGDRLGPALPDSVHSPDPQGKADSHPLKFLDPLGLPRRFLSGRSVAFLTLPWTLPCPCLGQGTHAWLCFGPKVNKLAAKTPCHASW